MQGLLDLLADEEDRSRRSVLVALVSQLAPENLDAVASRLSDARWYVARNAVTKLDWLARNQQQVAKAADGDEG